MIALLACVFAWAMQPALAPATPLAGEHLAYIGNNFPGVILQGWSRLEFLALAAGGLLGMLAAAKLASNEDFRRKLYLALGANGLLIAFLALAKRWIGVGNPPWVVIAEHKETYNICFFHHNFPGAAVNLAWPLLLFGSNWLPRRWSRSFFVFGVLVLVATALPLWRSLTAGALALSMAGAALIWRRLPEARRPSARLLTLLAAASLLFVLAWQTHILSDLERTHPDGWTDAPTALKEAPEREAALRILMSARRDHLVPSSAPARPVAWQTAARMATDYPVFGLGPGAWVARAILYSNDTLMHTFHQHRRFAQHDLLQTAAEWGGLPTLLWVAIWGFALIGAARLVPLGEGGLFLALFGLAMGSLVYFPLQNPAIQIWTALLLGVALGAPSTSKNPVSPLLPPR